MEYGQLSVDETERVGNMFDYIAQVSSISRHSFGNILNNQELSEYAELLGIPKNLQTLWLTQMQGVNSTVVNLHNTYVNSIFTSEEEVTDFIQEFYAANPEYRSFLSQIIAIQPVVALATAALLAEKESLSKQIVRPYIGWYKESMKIAGNVSKLIDSFFKTCEARVTTRKQAEFLLPVLQDWQKDMQLSIVEAMNLANCFAIHAQEADCVVFTAITPFGYKKGQQCYNPIIMKAEVESLGKYKVYATYYKDFLNANFAQRNSIYLPTISSAVDVVEYLKYMERYWNIIASSIAPTGRHSYVNNQEHQVWLKNTAKSIIRPERNKSGGARISICPKAPEFKEFDVRLDYDDKRKKLELDFGSMDLPSILKYAQMIGKQSSDKDIVMNYAAIVNNKGVMYASRKSKVEYYPAIMKTPFNGNLAQRGKNATLFAAVAASAGSQIGLRSGAHFSYHMSEHVKRGFKSRGHDFKEIAAAWKTMLTQNVT